MIDDACCVCVGGYEEARLPLHYDEYLGFESLSPGFCTLLCFSVCVVANFRDPRAVL